MNEFNKFVGKYSYIIIPMYFILFILSTFLQLNINSIWVGIGVLIFFVGVFYLAYNLGDYIELKKEKGL